MVYTTKNTNQDFNWNTYFTNFRSEGGEHANRDVETYFYTIRRWLGDNPHLMSIALGDVLRKLLKDVKLPVSPSVLELGAGTGFLTRMLLTLYGGTGLLVDNCMTPFEAYEKIKSPGDLSIQYRVEDFFRLDFSERFDVVCSFGVIEHFENKNEVLAVHKKFVKENGILILIVPMDSLLTRIYYEVHPEINLGYRELLTKKLAFEQLQQVGLTPLKVEISQGYVYDFMAILCQ